MAVGRLTHLASTVTLASGSSASATIPNSGTVAVGDLLLAACAIPSGSRTMSISGGAGAWTSLGSAMQSGHTSQIWWRIAASGDLGATITVTPSTGAICQVLLLGSVAGVAPTTPVTAAFTTSVSATTKTTPALTAPSGSCEISAVWDSRGASTPQTAVWTAPTGETRQGQAFTIPQAGSSSGAWGDSDVTVSGTIGGRLWTADQAALGSSWTLAVAPAVTDQTISAGVISSTATLYGPTAAPGAVALAPARIASTTVLYSPSLDPGAVNVSPGRIESQAVAYEAELLPGPAVLTPGLIGSTGILPAPALAPGPVVLAPQLVLPTAVVRQPTLGSASAVTPERIESGAVLYVPAASAGAVALAPAGIASAAVVYKPVVSGSGQQVELNHVTAGTPRTRWSANSPRGWGDAGAPRSRWAAGAPRT